MEPKETGVDLVRYITETSAEIGANEAMKKIESEQRRWENQRQDRRLFNTKLLLRNYRTLAMHCDNAITEIGDISDETSYDILNLMDSEKMNTLHVESIQRSRARTMIIVEHINTMIDLYEVYCQKTGRPAEARRSRIIRAMYIDETIYTADEIGEMECIDRRTVYKDIDMAVEKIAALLFGIDGLSRNHT